MRSNAGSAASPARTRLLPAVLTMHVARPVACSLGICPPVLAYLPLDPTGRTAPDPSRDSAPGFQSFPMLERPVAGRA